MRNTTESQDSEIRDAQNCRHIQDLVDIIEDLDSQLSEWKEAARDFDTPKHLAEFLAEQG